MDFRSLGTRSEMIFPAFEGEIIDRGEYVVIRTPSIPTFYWGNYLLFRDPPRPGDEVRWPRRFAEEIGEPPEVRHQVFGWDSPTGDPGSAHRFEALGFTVLQQSVLAAEDLSLPPRPAEGIEVRPLRTDRDWAMVIENQVQCRDLAHDEAGYRDFKQAEMGRYRRMAQAGVGAWFGAFLGDRLVADLGLYQAAGLGRYQSVETHPDFRRRGIAATLVERAGRYALDQMGVETLLIVADADSPAERLYRSVGFRPVERQAGLERW